MLSSDVGSRFYRAPEVLLMSRHYDTAADVWSVGVCISEAVRAFNIEQNFPESVNGLFNQKVHKDQLPLYQGISAYPLSPRSESQLEVNEVIEGLPERDQISVILADISGELKSKIDLSFLFD